jgi:NADPH:quinone reductase-like Zn-dependent oxidoreductase
MTTMRTIRQDELGGPEVLHVVEVPIPEPAPTEVLVRVAAAGVNPVDWKTRASGGRMGDPPFTVGWDVAGTVEALGEGVTRFEVGDRVFGMPAFPHEAAAYAEFVTARSRHLTKIPDTLTDVEAGALPLASLTAYQALVDTAGIGEGRRVLIQAAAGGVGHLGVQIAHARGAYVVGTARAVHHEELLRLGADELVDHTTTDVAGAVDEVDVVLDLVGGDVGRASLPIVRDGGLLISIPSAGDIPGLRDAADGRIRVTGMLVEPDRAGMEAVAALAADGRLKADVAETFPLEEASRAHDLGERGAIGGGKLVLTPAS